MTSEKGVSAWTLATGEIMPQTDYPAVRKKPIAPSNKAPEVLIVEKEKLLRLMMAKLLQVSGYKVYTCGDSQQALAYLV